MVVLFVLRPLVVDVLHILDDKFVPSPPKRFAQAVGLIFSAGCVLCAAMRWGIALYTVAAMFLVATALGKRCCNMLHRRVRQVLIM
jgi:hypothetical protein